MSPSAPVLNLPGLATPSVQAAAPAPAAAPSASADAADLGLEIEDDKAAGEYVYMTVNRVTGEVVAQWPSPQLLALRSSPSYTPGKVISSLA
jgi:flagellar protein FlaG